MGRNLTLFKDNHGTVVVNNHIPQESKSEPVNGRFESWRVQKLKAFCFDKNITISDSLRNSTDLYQDIYDPIEKAKRAGRYEELVELIHNIAKIF